MALFPVDAKALLGPAEATLRRRARLMDTTIADIHRARDAMREAQVALGPTRALCDIVVGQRVAPERVRYQFENWTKDQARIQSLPALRAARAVLEGLDALHFPVAFPEVFLRRDPGFDVILGNPPWEKPMVEVHAFWARHFPGLRGMDTADRERALRRLPRERPDLQAELGKEEGAAERERAVLLAGNYPGMGKGHADSYRAFAWRFWQLAAVENGCVGVVLPRAALVTPGLEELRRRIFGGCDAVNIVTLTNRAGWIFEEVHHQFTVALLGFRRGVPRVEAISLRGPYAGPDQFAAGQGQAPRRFGSEEVLGWTGAAGIPLFPTEGSAAVFSTMRRSPRLGQKVPGEWHARPEQELNATSDRGLMVVSPRSTDGLWPVMKGESFDIWEPDRGPGTYFAWAVPETPIAHLHEKRLRSAVRRTDSAHRDFSASHLRNAATLACHRARIAFRDVTRATDSRTVRSALLPPRVFATHKAPVLLWPRGNEQDEAFLLAVLCSIPLDWYARRLVEITLSFAIFNDFPIPRPPRSDPHWQRAVALAGRLAAPDERFAEWAAAVGVAHGPLDPAAKQAMIEELDAVVARLYGLSPEQLTHIFDTFHEWPRAEERIAWAARRDRTVALLRALG
ncbi:MAG: hypothetical protein K2X74_12405 [Acetobacteraceae bacterium]|nr:hypothetical protein [Acetobacteraceae bacterium]